MCVQFIAFSHFFLHKKYKILRNRTTNRIRKDTIKANGERIEEANNEQEIWKIVKEINNPRQEAVWSLNENNEKIEDETKISNVFNKAKHSSIEIGGVGIGVLYHILQ